MNEKIFDRNYAQESLRFFITALHIELCDSRIRDAILMYQDDFRQNCVGYTDEMLQDTFEEYIIAILHLYRQDLKKRK